MSKDSCGSDFFSAHGKLLGLIDGTLTWTSVESDDSGQAERSRAFKELHHLSPAGQLSMLQLGRKSGTLVTNIV